MNCGFERYLTKLIIKKFNNDFSIFQFKIRKNDR